MLQVPLDVTFHPQEVSRDISYESLPCEIEGSTPLYLTLSGVCIEKTSTKEVSIQVTYLHVYSKSTAYHLLYIGCAVNS